MVFDWKTNATVPKYIGNDPQFIIYDKAYELVYGKKADGIYFASLKSGGLIRYTESKEHSDALINHIIPNYIEDVRKKNFIKQGLFNGSCYRCPFKIPCLGEKSSELVSTSIIEE
jgi:hypothetical protein